MFYSTSTFILLVATLLGFLACLLISGFLLLIISITPFTISSSNDGEPLDSSICEINSSERTKAANSFDIFFSTTASLLFNMLLCSVTYTVDLPSILLNL